MRHWKTIVSFLLVFAVLGGAYFFLQNYEPDENITGSTSKPAIPLLSLQTDLVQKLCVENETGTFAFIREGDGWLVEGAPSITLYPERIESLCFSAASLSADVKIADAPDNLELYGLDTPKASVTLSDKEGNKTLFFIGDMTATGDGYYVCLDSNSAVYQVPSGTISPFLNPLSAFRVMTITNLNFSDIRAIAINKSGETFRVVYKAPAEGTPSGAVSAWFIESPEGRDANDTLVQEKLLLPISKITASGIAAENLVKKDTFGFSGDYAEVSTDTETIRFFVGTRNGESYVYVDGKETIYEMGKETLSFMSVTPFDILEKMTTLIPIDTVKSIALSLSGTEAKMEMVQEGETVKYMVNDKPAGEDAFKSMYLELSALTVDGTVSKVVDVRGKTPSASIVYTLQDGSTTTLAYYPYDALNYAIFENGENSFYMKKTKLTELAGKLARFLENPKG